MISDPGKVAAAARRQLAAQRRPVGEFDASRYFRSTATLEFFNVGTAVIRRYAREIVDAHADWDGETALICSEALLRDAVLDVKQLGVEILARYHRQFTPAMLPVWKRWLAANYANNWATVDGLCGSVISRLLERHPELIPRVVEWSRHRNMWVRRASAVSLVRGARRGDWLDAAYDVVERQHASGEDLIQKALGWLLREAGKKDVPRLERYLRSRGGALPRTTVRYAIERFPEAERLALLTATRAQRRPAAATARSSRRAS